MATYNEEISRHTVKWVPSSLCQTCGEAAHIDFCPKPHGITAKQWQRMSDAKRQAREKVERSWWTDTLFPVELADLNRLFRAKSWLFFKGYKKIGYHR